MARVVIFPWLVWISCRLAAEAIIRRLVRTPRRAALATRALHRTFFVVLGIPTIFVVTAELLITLNDLSLGEQADYRLRSDFSLGFDGGLELPGPESPTPAPVSADAGEAYRRYLVELFSPVIIHKISHHPEWDIPVLLHFDGNRDPRDNVRNEPLHRPHQAGVYGEVTAETEDSFYLTYSLYHIKDYDHPVREIISSWTFHDNDNEGWMIRVDKASMRVADVETWFHNRFFLCNATGESTGTEPIQGRAHFENETHFIAYAQSMGHGVRCAQSTDLASLGENTKILRFRGARPAVPVIADTSFQSDATYELEGFDDWYALARGPLGTEGRGRGMFEEEIPLGHAPDGTPLVIGRFIAGHDYAKGSWSRPKPMWSWDDGWDDVPIFVWHFFPAYAFHSHSGVSVSQEYRYSRPVEKVFGVPPAELFAMLDLEVQKRRGAKWANIERTHASRVGVDKYVNAGWKLLKSYVNYLFNALG